MTAPKVIPLTKYLWITAPAIIIGRLMIMPYAAPAPDMPEIPYVSAIGSVTTFLSVSIPANRKSFQVNIMVKMLAAARPGATSGNEILQKARNLEQPSTIALSSTSLGNSEKKPNISQVKKGRPNAV